ncbi:hypothetical protein TGP89_421660 [Toxoplasma gondii p89]|nr:hypothetical protein TGP89_421660 [Toxoplasma gondii p89]
MPRGERRQRAKAESTSPTREPDAPCSSVAFRCPSSLSDSSSASACVSSLRPSSASRTTSPTSSHASPYSSSSSRSSSSLSSHFSSLSSSPSRASPLPSPDSASFSSVSSPPLASASPRPSSASLGLSLDRFQLICVLAGCDYAPNIPGVGVRTAARLVRRHGADVHAVRLFVRSQRFRQHHST